MLLTAAAIAILQEGPKPGKPIGDVPEWIRASDQPRGVVGAVRFKVLFTPDGKPDRCDIVATTGEPKVEEAACAAIRKRFRYKPSFGSTGAPIYRIMERAGYFGLKGPRTAHIPTPVMYALRDKQDAGTDFLGLLVEVDEAGGLVTCGSWDSETKAKAIAATACEQVAKIWKPLAEVDSGGRPVRYFRDIRVLP